MPTELTDMEITEISLVDEPANADARVVIVKAKTKEQDMKPCDDCKTAAACKKAGECAGKATAKGEKKPFPMAKVAAAVRTAMEDLAPQIAAQAVADGFPENAAVEALAAAEAIVKETVMDLESLAKALETAEAKIAEVEKRADAAEARAAAAEAEIAKASPPPPAPSDEEVLKSLPEAIRKRVEAAEARAKAAEDEIAKARDASELKEAIAKAQAIGVGDAEKLGSLLLRVSKGRTSPADAAEIEQMLGHLGEIAKASPLFRAIGTAPADNDGDPEAILKAKANEIVAAGEGKVTFAQAYERAVSGNPSLYSAYLAKRRRA